MKYFGLIIASLLFSILASGQDIFPIGATWHYSERFAHSGDYLYMTMVCTGDTTIDEFPCRIIEKSKIQGCSNRPHKEYFHVNDTGEVFFFDNSLDKFQKLFDFEADIGDSWTILLTLSDEIVDTVSYTVDSISSLYINGVVHRVFHTTSVFTNWHYSPGYLTYIENIGDVNYFFPWHIGYCDANYFGGLRCYEDNIIGFYSTELVDSCNYVRYETGYKTLLGSDEFRVFPIPTSNLVFLEHEGYTSGQYNLYDINGRVSLAGEFTGQKFEIDISGLSDGIYLIDIQSNSNTLYRERIIKSNSK